MNANLFVEFQIGEFEDQFLQWFRFRLRRCGNFRRESLSNDDENRIHAYFDSTGITTHGSAARRLRTNASSWELWEMKSLVITCESRLS